MYILHQNRKSGRVDPIPLAGAPFSHYYAQENADEGIIMETDVTIKEVSIKSSSTVSLAKTTSR